MYVCLFIYYGRDFNLYKTKRSGDVCMYVCLFIDYYLILFFSPAGDDDEKSPVGVLRHDQNKKPIKSLEGFYVQNINSTH